MLTPSSQIAEYLKTHYKTAILKQVPQNCDLAEVLLTIDLKLDLTRIFRSNREIGTYLLSHFVGFEKDAMAAINEMLGENGFGLPGHGIKLNVSISNCFLPAQDVESTEFQIAAMEQKNGIMVYIRGAQILELGVHEVYLYSAK